MVGAYEWLQVVILEEVPSFHSSQVFRCRCLLVSLGSSMRALGPQTLKRSSWALGSGRIGLRFVALSPLPSISASLNLHSETQSPGALEQKIQFIQMLPSTYQQ